MALTKQQADLRTSCFSGNDYIQNQVFIELLTGQSYKALVKTLFTLNQVDQQLFIDWQGKEVENIYINGNQLSQQQIIELSAENKIFFPVDHLKQGLNELNIKFTNEYSTSGHGLHSFIDTDGSQYVYSQCEPHHASKMFPCFDQPDLKGQFKLYAIAPQEWTVISNEEVVEFNEDEGIKQFLDKFQMFNALQNYKRWEFKNTKPLSTYLYAILSGPYQEIKCPVELLHRNIPQSIFCRNSLLKYVQKDAEEIFSLTSNSMNFFEKLFGYPYPFSKYDQIFCPEYSSGAMENAGAVTINDCYVFKEDVPIASRADRQNTITHELSHMWFGDLVTMKWWDDLWLNESFAEFVSHLCLAEIKPKEIEGVDMWVQFYERKVWGYVEDQMQTTHPIYCDIQNTDQSENIFDGITYAKGAAILKQLYFMMGQNTFSHAMSIYFNRHQYKNSTLSDFFKAMQEAFNQHKLQIDIDLFQNQWIMKAGLNQIKASIDKNSQFIVQQEAVLAEYPTLRNQIFRVCFLDAEGQVIAIEQVHLEAQKETYITFNNFNLLNAKGFILNYNDESFIKTIYDKDQVTFLLKHLSKINPSLSRVLILRSIWDQVRDGQVCFLDFLDGVINHIQYETDDTINKMLLSWCMGGVDFYSPIKIRKTIRDRLAATILNLIQNTPSNNKNKLLVLKKYLCSWARSPTYLQNLIPYLSTNSSELPLGNVGLNNGWKIIQNIFKYLDIPLQQKWEFFEKQALLDGTDEVVKQKRFLNALLETNRNNLWQSFIEYNKTDSVQMAAQTMSGFNNEIHLDDLAQYEPKFFEILEHIFKTKDSEYAKAFYSSLYPIGDNIEFYIKSCENLLQNKNITNDILIRNLKESIDMDKRRLKTYQTFPLQSQ